MERDEEPTIRLVTGEVTSELFALQDAATWEDDHAFCHFDWRMLAPIGDTFMAVLARHDGKQIINEDNIPPRPLPPERRRIRFHPVQTRTKAEEGK